MIELHHLKQYDAALKSFINKKSFLLLYPSIFIVGVVISALIPSKSFDVIKDNSWIVSSDNWLNKNFAYKGNHIFAIIFTGIFAINVLQELKLQAGTSSSGASQKSEDDVIIKLSWQKFKHFTLKFSMKIIVLFLLFFAIDHVFLMTGGKCVIDKAVANILAKSSKTLQQCAEYNGTWVRLQEGFCLITPDQLSRRISSAQICYKYGEWEGGFDISGHFCFITTLSLILWYELYDFEISYFHNDVESQKQSESSSWLDFTVTNVVRWCVLICLSIWIEVLLVTSIFYHTVLEKLLGLALGYVAPLLFYHVLPEIKSLHDILY